MRRRLFLQRIATPVLLAPPVVGAVRRALAADSPEPWITAEQAADWRTRWEKEILGTTRTRYCDKETGEELGWLVSPLLEGFYQGYLVTRDAEWVARLVEWMDACVRRATKEPDGFPGWPKGDGGGGESTEFSADSLLGEAMMLRPVVLMADTILKTPALTARFGDAARRYIKLAEDIFQKWDTRGCWRPTKNGGLWIVPAFGIDRQTGQWSAGYAQRTTAGFSNPANKENHIARWLIALFDVTGKPVYRQRAEGWWDVMRSRMRPREDGKFYVWNYWDPAGPWDYKPDGSPKHWVGVHPNGGYYGIDVESMVAAFEHGLVFDRDDLARLIRTNRDFMWNQQMTGARFQRIDGGQPDPRWKNSPGVLWTALIPHDATLRKIFVANHDPVGWGGIAATPWFLAKAATAAGAKPASY
jgi:hypothetical protein